MADNENNTINAAIGQIVAYYPFRYKTKKDINENFDDVFKIADGSSLVDSIKIENSKVNYDTYVKIVDSDINVSKNNEDNKYCRSLYSVGLLDSEEDKKKIQKTFNFGTISQANKDNKNVTDFVKAITDTIDTARNNLKGKDKIDDSINGNYCVSKINVILYPETNIGFVEIFIDYAFKEDADPEKMAYCMNVDGGAIKKLLFVNTNADDSDTEANRIKVLIKICEDNRKAFIKFVSNIDEIRKNKKIYIKDDDIMFNCKENKKRAYAFSYLAIKDDLYKKYELDKPENINKLNTILHYLGRCHGDSSTRAFNTSDIARFLHTDDTFCTWSITKVSFGTLFVYNNDRIFKYTTRALDEQHVFLYEMCLHLRFYLYSVIEEYRKPQTYNTYYSLKGKYADIMTRYNLSMVSEVETQELYEIIRERFDINKIISDANESLERVLIADQAKKARTHRIVAVLTALCAAMVAISNLLPESTLANSSISTFFKCSEYGLIILTLWNVIIENTVSNRK